MTGVQTCALPILLVPCIWHKALVGGDLASHLYNTWLVQLVKSGQAPGLWISAQWTNVLFDWMLEGFARFLPIHLAGRVAVYVSVLTFFWGAFSFVSVARGRPAWVIAPLLAMAAFGWTEDQYRLLFKSLVMEGQEAVWSMGDDAPPAFLSQLRRPLWDYCKQRFAQVTNPPIDALRETHVMSLRVPISDTLVLSSPLLDAGQLEQLEHEFQIQHFSLAFPARDGAAGARVALEWLQATLQALPASSRPLVVLDDRGMDAEHACLPVLLAASAIFWLLQRRRPAPA